MVSCPRRLDRRHPRMSRFPEEFEQEIKIDNPREFEYKFKLEKP
jgi:hypothetical protein